MISLKVYLFHFWSVNPLADLGIKTVLRFLNFEKHLLHRDISWANIILDPRRVGHKYKSMAEKQPKTFGDFTDPGSCSTRFEEYEIEGMSIQPLGTVALLDLELAARLDPTENARKDVTATVCL